MGIQNRPYVGTWKLNGKKVVQHTPDVLVYLNGDTSLPGCEKCHTRIDIQQFLVQVDVDAGTDPTGGSASFTLAVPIHHHASFARDARLLIIPGLEVHIYERGYFPVKGLYSNLEQPAGNAKVLTETEAVFQSVPQGRNLEAPPPSDNLTHDQLNTWASQIGVPPDQLAGAIVAYNESGDPREQEYILHSIYNRAINRGRSVWDVITGTAHTTGPQNRDRPYSSRKLPTGEALGRVLDKAGAVLSDRATTGNSGSSVLSFFHTATQSSLHQKDPANYKAPEQVDKEFRKTLKPLNDELDFDPARVQFYGRKKPFSPEVVQQKAQESLGGLPNSQSETDSGPEKSDIQSRTGNQLGSPTLTDQGLGGYDIENILAYPYYHVFHGVVSNVSMVYDAGVQTFTVTCISMLQLWQYLPVSVNASIFGARAANSKNHISVMGHNFTGLHPYAIIYRLYEDIAGAGAGVSWALSQMTNTDASFGGTSLYSAMVKYWERRFKVSQTKLRLHGATGEMFNSFQAVLLGRYISAADLTNALKKRFGAEEGVVSAKVFGKSLGSNLGSRRALAALVAGRLGSNADNPNAKGTGDFDLNMAEMIAFTTKLGQIGQFQFFESTYETKMNIAQEVCRVTGFEFYQDVDGDFVFKPPFYNMDTSSSRVYRIEDIDIISLNVDEKEPQYTWIVAKGNWFQNLEDHGVENEWGIQGTYIDYRLVAQFGWRMATFECSYLTDKRSVFFMAIAQMDLQNTAMHTATLTIPIRPEMRPGYPVYIVPLDCFYYVNHLSHSFSMGGRCTTNLQLTAKRAKFYAPGDPNKRGIEAIDLGDLTRPPRPLEVLDNAGRPSLAGFPNVVMALDPDHINPAFFILGADFDLIDTPEKARALLNSLVDFGILTPEYDNDGNETGLYSYREGDNAKVVFYFSTGEGRAPAGAFDFVAAANEWSKAVQKSGDEKARLRKQLDDLNLQIASAESEAASLSGSTAPKDVKRRKELNELLYVRSYVIRRATPKKKPKEGEGPQAAEKAKAPVRVPMGGLYARRDEIAARLKGENFVIDTKGNPQLQAFLDVMNARASAARANSGAPNFKNLAATVNLLDVLSDKKAIINNGTLPGAYRYFSASHPDPKQQGMMPPSFDGWGEGVEPRNPLLLPEWTKKPIQGFLPSNQIILPAGAKTKPEAMLGDMSPTWGLRILTHKPDNPEEVVPTSEIRELSWAVHHLRVPVKKGSAHRRRNANKTSASKTRGVFYAELLDRLNRRTSESTPSSLFDPWTQDLNNRIQAAVGQLQSDPKFTGLAPSSFPQMIPPTYLTIRDYSFDTSQSLKDYDFNGGNKRSFRGAGSTTTPETWVWKQLAQAYSGAIYSQFVGASAAWNVQLQNKTIQMGTSEATRKIEEIWDAFYLMVLSNIAPADVSYDTRDKATSSSIQSPVFPVSDARGYEVIGSFRYGRGVDIDPDGVFDTLHKQDPLHMLDQSTIVRLVDDLVGKNNSISSETQRKMIQELRAGMSDQQLIDLKLLTESKADPTALQLSFMNWWANTGRDGVHKVPVNNAAYSLADLNVVANNGVCSCKAAEASIVLEAAGMTGFLQVAAPADDVPGEGGTTADNVTPWLQRSAEQAAQQWAMTQQALRGQALNTEGTAIVQSILDFKTGAAFEQAEMQTRQSRNDLAASVDALRSAGSDVEKSFTP